MAPMKLYTFAGEFRAYKALISAQYNGVVLVSARAVETMKLLTGVVHDVQPITSMRICRASLQECPKFEQGKDNLSKEFLALSPLGKLPVLETPHGSVFESNAIARYVAKIRRDTELAGRTFFEAAQVDSWMDFCSHDVELPVTMWVYPVLGYMDFKQPVHDTAVENTMKSLAVLERHLLSRTFVVGEFVTLADICLVSALYYPFKLVLDEAARQPYPSVTRWFMTCVNQPAFKAVLGEVELCTEAMGAAAAGAKGKVSVAPPAVPKPAEKKKEEKPKVEKPKVEEKPKEKKKKDDDDEEEDDMAAFKEVKKADPFAVLAPTKMNMDEWKRTYSNSRDDYYASMKWFWDNLDSEGYTLWTSKYKYNAENKVDWQTSNLIGGFLQRCDEVRKYAFGCLVVLGDKAPFEVEGVWMIRGKDIGLKAMIDANPDAEYYDWAPLDHTNEDVKKMVGDFWCSSTVLNGKPIYDSKIFK